MPLPLTWTELLSCFFRSGNIQLANLLPFRTAANCNIITSGYSSGVVNTASGRDDTRSGMQVLSNISKRMADMHEAGYVHRDLKPANVIWLRRQNRWTVIDFGCAARIGDMAPLTFTLTYAPPEVVHAFVAGEQKTEASPAIDAWALGVMAFELLTGSPAFDLLTAGTASVRTSGSLTLPAYHTQRTEPRNHLLAPTCD